MRNLLVTAESEVVMWSSTEAGDELNYQPFGLDRHLFYEGTIWLSSEGQFIPWLIIPPSY